MHQRKSEERHVSACSVISIYSTIRSCLAIYFESSNNMQSNFFQYLLLLYYLWFEYTNKYRHDLKEQAMMWTKANKCVPPKINVDQLSVVCFEKTNQFDVSFSCTLPNR